MRILLYGLAILLCTGCYEDRVGCLDPDADNYDLQADEGCTDCCVYPDFSIRISPEWNDTALVVGQTYTDGAGHPFQLIRFRYYLGELRLESTATELAEPARPVELQEGIAGDTTDVILNGNYLLATTTVTTSTVGTLRIGTAALRSFSGTYGLPDRYRNVIPFTAPSGDALRTQPGRLNYRDGRGYVQSRLEYTLTPGGDTLSVSSYGSVPFSLDFGDDLLPERGLDLRLDVTAQLDLLLGSIDLTADSATIAQALDREVDFLRPVAIVQ
ncbi:hypothetical protein LEM8419_00652 [Neolewinella maritima]|uniref:Lipoprotein n=1 Tax=Neolewinella maritima TaxID=1383882 RepID=A0ABM9AXU3_9BACT|nr:hypothetical protein [Neolewinella maritima]CAH0999354.1 hypothetical protein LEM8419_00652 [Neolewinella maritima]